MAACTLLQPPAMRWVSWCLYPSVQPVYLGLSSAVGRLHAVGVVQPAAAHKYAAMLAEMCLNPLVLQAKGLLNSGI